MRKFSFKRKFATSLMFLAMLASANAESLIIEDTSGKTTSYDLGSKPVITYSGDNLVLKTDLANAEFALPQVAKYYFKADATSNDDVLLNPTNTYVVVTEESFTLRNGIAGSPVFVLSIDGKVLSNHVVATDGTLDISLSNLPQGIYIIKTKSANIKFIRK
ncbi:MAG: T9SS type A sorting domain-containing protein [Paludibacteraceae bacterium]|nr:T9SS type A sorting domain-containing protein [Paludibacteraceae bacterium]